jgi:molybdopterin-guanine dinucleotide biosynthesis protein B
MRIFGIVGWKNSGKTTLVEKLVAHIIGRGYSVSTIKHAHHNFDIDHEGRDSFRHREAGASEVLISSPKRFALMHEVRNEDEYSLNDLLPRLKPVDLIIVEGFKSDTHPKLEIMGERREKDKDKSLLSLDDDTVIAAASDVSPEGIEKPYFKREDISGIADFILEHVGLSLEVKS